jgi:hypothetical protein
MPAFVSHLLCNFTRTSYVLYNSVSQPPGRGLVPGPNINYTVPRLIKKEFTWPRPDNG